MVLSKKEVYTIVTPIPSFIPRQLAIDILHSHGEVINVNPLVLSYKQIKAPRTAAADEYFSTWYEITERVQVLPGIGKLGSSKISFNACFHDVPWGLQSHVYAPLGIDMRNKYRIAGNQPGVEPPEQAELGLAELGVPKTGLYLREDIEIRCNITMVSTVKSQMKAASKEMVNRIIKKAELLDAGILRAMIEDGKMKTFNPLDPTYTGGLQEARSPQLSPAAPFGGMQIPTSPTIPYQVPRPVSVDPNRPGTSGSLGYPAHWQAQQQAMADQSSGQRYAEMPNSQTVAPGSQSFPMELPGDFYHTQPSPRFQQPQPSPTNQPPLNGRASSNSLQSHSPDPSGRRWSQGTNGQPSPSMNSSRPTSYSSDSGMGPSPGPDNKGYTAELSTHRETAEEHGDRLGKPPAYRQHSQGYPYNPADYARAGR
ncbi:hypothetical protein F5Y18DRAFT_408116 [Xylariaceae sp. FL1019]|nr:hypothetical protein F5Y18DRAFT_408116 [Xylariaceae sp. FL1019]